MPSSVVNPETFDDEWFGGLSDREMIIWIGVFTRLRDDQGRFVENAALARARLFPYRDVPVADVQAAFDRFVADGRLFRYEAGGRHLLQLVNWWRYAHWQWAASSRLPAPEGWTDRVRMLHAKHGYQAVNWKEPGGFASAQVERPPRAANVEASESESESESEEQQRSLPKPRRVSAVSAAEWERRKDEAIAAAWFPDELRELCNVMADANKTGSVALSRLVRDLYEPVVKMQGELSREALAYGLQAALRKGAPNATYVRKAALSYRGQQVITGNGSRSLTLEQRIARLTEYDKQALDDPDLRGPFLERFGARVGITEEGS